MALQTFTASQVLTATQMNNLQANDYNWTVTAKTASYVLTAADKGTTITMSNAGATTITVNNSLFSAGDTLRIYNIGAGTCTVTAGTTTVTHEHVEQATCPGYCQSSVCRKCQKRVINTANGD